MSTLNDKAKLEVYAALKDLIEQEYGSNGYDNAKKKLHCIMRKFDENKESKKAQVIVELLKASLQIIQFIDPEKAILLSYWIRGQRKKKLRSKHKDKCTKLRW